MEHSSSHTEKLRPGYFFLSLGVVVSLITTVTSFLNLIFETLNKKFPDALNAAYEYGYNTYNFENVRMALATVIIFFPVFLILSYFWSKASRQHLSHADTIVRKWMIYLILFIAALVIVIDLVVLVRYFVSGEITTRFIFKTLAALVTALIAGSYYALETRLSKETTLPKAYAILSALIVLGSIFWSFSIIGSPSTQRLLRLDDRRVQDLQSLQNQVIMYWQQKEKLPESIDVLSDPLSSYMVPVDPEFEKGMAYEYKKTGALSFQLCSTFSLPMPKGWQEYSNGGGIAIAEPSRDMASSYPYNGGKTESWDHETGHTCFDRTIDKDVYPPYKKEVR